MAHPLLEKKHVFHESRFITTSDAVVEIYDADPDVRNQNDWDTAWGLRNGVIICETKDSVYQAANARLIAAAPELLAALVSAMSNIPDPDDVDDGRADSLDEYGKWWARAMHKQARTAITKATQ